MERPDFAAGLVQLTYQPDDIEEFGEVKGKFTMY